MSDGEKATVVVTDVAPEGFQSFTRGSFLSERSASRAADKRAKTTGLPVYVVHVPACRLFGESWIVGHVPAKKEG